MHYHLYVGGDTLFHNEAEYEDATDSIRAFLGMADGFIGHLIEVPDDTESTLFDMVDKGKPGALYVECGAMKVIWSICEDVCVKAMRN